jgi:aspartate aminotransferase-like enzyme
MTELNLQRQEAPLRRLMGPGPLDVHPRVYKALSSPVIGYMEPQYRLPTLNTVVIPDGVDDLKLRRYLLEKFKLDIGGGFGRLAGKVWRLGLMGYSSSADNVLFFIPVISRALAVQGIKTDLSAGLDAVLTELDGNGIEAAAAEAQKIAAA